MAETGNKLHLEVITPDAAVLSQDVDYVLVRALDGDLGVMPQHAPLIASLSIWPIYYDINGTRHAVTAAAGFLEVHDNTVTVITPAAEKPEDIDVNRAQSAKQRAEKRLRERKEGLDVDRAEVALQKALRRLDIASQYGSHQ